jgi:hypothetical protein
MIIILPIILYFVFILAFYFFIIDSSTKVFKEFEKNVKYLDYILIKINKFQENYSKTNTIKFLFIDLFMTIFEFIINTFGTLLIPIITIIKVSINKNK